MRIGLLKDFRREAKRNLDFFGSWSGYFITYIYGEKYESGRVSGYKYMTDDTGTFIQESILDYIHGHYKRYKNRNTKKHNRKND